MIFQLGLDLDIQNKTVQAVIDLDTGMVGFSEKGDGKTIEYSYFNCPKEYRLAFFKRLESAASSEKMSNTEICRKSEAARLLTDFWGKRNNEI